VRPKKCGTNNMIFEPKRGGHAQAWGDKDCGCCTFVPMPTTRGGTMDESLSCNQYPGMQMQGTSAALASKMLYSSALTATKMVATLCVWDATGVVVRRTMATGG
jgi:hypothetical protein